MEDKIKMSEQIFTGDFLKIWKEEDKVKFDIENINQLLTFSLKEWNDFCKDVEKFLRKRDSIIFEILDILKTKKVFEKIKDLSEDSFIQRDIMDNEGNSLEVSIHKYDDTSALVEFTKNEKVFNRLIYIYQTGEVRFL